MAQQKNASTSKLKQRSNQSANTPTTAEGMRLDKWLWCARFYKTRTLATEEIGKGRIQVNQAASKASREIKVGDSLQITQGPSKRVVVVKALSGLRGPAAVAQQLYEETAESIARRLQQSALRQLAPEPADMLQHGRPTKKDRRDMQDFTTRWDDEDADADAGSWQEIEGCDTEREPKRGALNERWSATHKPSVP